MGFVSDINERRQMAADLQASKERFRALVNTTPDRIFSVDSESRHTAVNSAVCKTRGLSEERIIGLSYAEIGIPVEPAETWRGLDRHVLEGGSVRSGMLIPIPDAGLRNFDVVLYPGSAFAEQSKLD